MCDLCDPETRRGAAKAALRFAEELEEFAALQRRLASGEAKPHDPHESDDRRTRARALIRKLVEGWL